MASAVKPVAAGLVALLIVAVPRVALAQECPKPDPVAQKAKEQECLAAGDEWGKFGAIAHLCEICGCAPRTKTAESPAATGPSANTCAFTRAERRSGRR
jgi:hypothetical protein